MQNNSLWMRRLAITDLETTGLSPQRHEILEIGLLVVSPETLAILDRWETKVKPERLVDADPIALKVNRYAHAEWKDAVSLHDAMREYARRTRGAVLLGHNVSFDWSFLLSASQAVNVPLELHYHRLDLLSMAYVKLHGRPEVGSLRLEELAKFFGITNPAPHRAMGDTLTAYEIFKKLVTLPDYGRDRRAG